MRSMRVALVAVVVIAACGGHPPPPPRGVVESDLGTWKFHRFQALLDVEVHVSGNKAEGYTASYITAEAEARGRIKDSDLVNVFVTRFRSGDGVVRATVKLARRLAQDGGYQVEEDKIGGARTLMISGRGETWVMWPSDKTVVKIGGRGRRDVPQEMVASYADRYPSVLPGGSLEGPLPPGPDDAPPPKLEKPAYDTNNPRPDVEHYDPNKVKLPDSSPDSDGSAAAAKPDDDAAKPADEAPKPTKKKKKKPAQPPPQ